MNDDAPSPTDLSPPLRYFSADAKDRNRWAGMPGRHDPRDEFDLDAGSFAMARYAERLRREANDGPGRI